MNSYNQNTYFYNRNMNYPNSSISNNLINKLYKLKIYKKINKTLKIYQKKK